MRQAHPVQQDPAQGQRGQQGQQPQQQETSSAEISSAQYWSQRFAAASAEPAPGQAPAPDQHAPEPGAPAPNAALPNAAAPNAAAPNALDPQNLDPEATARQPFVRPEPQQAANQQGVGQPQQQAHPGQQVSGQLEEATEKIRPLSQGGNGPPGTAMLAHPPQDDLYSHSGALVPEPGSEFGADYADYADYDEFDDYGYEADYAGDPRGPVPGDPDDLDEDEERSPGKEWFVLTAQGFGGLLVGAVVFVGFKWLWTVSSVAAFVAALVVTGGLVLLARRMRGDDLQIILLAVLAGLFCTVSPVALLLLGH